MEIEAVSGRNRRETAEFLKARWFSDKMAVRGELVDLAALPGFVAREGGRIVGAVTWREKSREEWEILSLDSILERRGVGTALLNRAVGAARAARCAWVTLIATNDNTGAMRFYQRRGFDMARLYRDALDADRRLKPSIPLRGEGGIPLRHEVEFRLALTPEKPNPEKAAP